jgi:hypothetical protein
LGLGKENIERLETAVNDSSVIPLNGVSRVRIPPPPLRNPLIAIPNPTGRRSWLLRVQRPVTLPEKTPYRDFVEESIVELTWLWDDETPEASSPE